jgi:hypothetical protein
MNSQLLRQAHSLTKNSITIPSSSTPLLIGCPCAVYGRMNPLGHHARQHCRNTVGICDGGPADLKERLNHFGKILGVEAVP